MIAPSAGRLARTADPWELCVMYSVERPALVAVKCDEPEISRYGNGTARRGMKSRLLWPALRTAALFVVAEMPVSQFSVTCKQRSRRIAQAVRIRDAEIALIDAHIRRCLPVVRLSEAPQLGELLTHVRIEASEAGSGT
jgi:hypothetical protein